MGIVARLMERRSTQPTSSWPYTAQWLVDAMGDGYPTAAGIKVDERNAYSIIAVWSCVQLIAGSLASLPLPLYQRMIPRGKKRVPDNRLYPILHDMPNREMSSFEFREALEGHLLTWGNAFAEIERDNAGRILGLWPLRPDRMKVGRIDGELAYQYKLGGAEPVILSADQVFHLRGFGYDGIVGYSPIQQAREALALAKATEKFGASWFGNGSRPGGVLTHPNKLTPEAKTRLKESWESAQRGLDNASRVAVLEEGIEWKQIGVPPEDSQFLETRGFQLSEVARLYNVPLHMLAHPERVANNTVEQQSIEFTTHTMRPWFVRWEQGIARSLLTPAERKQYFAEFVIAGLLRGEIQSRYTAYATGRQNGWLSANDIREIENMNPVEGGDVYLVPLNMVPADSVTGDAAPANEPKAGEPTPTKGSGPNGSGARSVRSGRKHQLVVLRSRLRAAYRPMFVDAAARVIRREKADVMRAAEKHLAQRSVVDLEQWLEQFYNDHQDFVQQQMGPVFSSYAEAMHNAAADEIGMDPSPQSPAMQRFLKDYAAAYAAHHVGSSLGQLRSVVRGTGTAPEDILSALQERFTEWEARRPGKIADTQKVRAGDAFSKATYESGGVRDLEWVTGDSESCPYCSHLNGTIVGIQHSFVPAGDGVHPDGVDEPLYPSRNIGHAPLHEGCECAVISVQ